jgi:lysyl endopeptidase
MKTKIFRRITIVLLMTCLASGAALTSSGNNLVTIQPTALLAERVQAGFVLDFAAESPHPAIDGWTQTYTFPGANFLRLHFTGFHLQDGDRLVVSNPDGTQAWEYTERGSNHNGDFWSFAIHGEQVTLSLLAPSGKSYGFHLIEVGYGTMALEDSLPVPETVFDTDGREDIACHMDEPVIAASQKPVAHLLFTDNKFQYLCTGELVRGVYANTLITNEHCINSQEIVDSLEARFNYQYTTCGGTELSKARSYTGDTWLKSNFINYNKGKPYTGLDYTLLTLQGNPEAKFKELIPTSASYDVGEIINFIQHPGGLPKQIGYWEDAAGTIRCNIATVSETYANTHPNSQIGYGCDSAGGSSGSAITRASDGKMIGLHHYGSVTPELNSATMMSYICADAADLLICDNE